MDKKQASQSGVGLNPLTPEERRQAEKNLLACLEAYERGGDKALDVELNRIHNPETAPYHMNPHFVWKDRPLRRKKSA
jgi:hypothetical protein